MGGGEKDAGWLMWVRRLRLGGSVLKPQLRQSVSTLGVLGYSW